MVKNFVVLIFAAAGLSVKFCTMWKFSLYGTIQIYLRCGNGEVSNTWIAHMPNPDCTHHHELLENIQHTCMQFMGGVNKSDQYLVYHNVLCITVQYWKTLFYHMIDVAIVNAFVLYNHLALLSGFRPVSENDFCDELVLQIIEKYGRQKPRRPSRSVMFDMEVFSCHPRGDVNIASSWESHLDSLSTRARLHGPTSTLPDDSEWLPFIMAFTIIRWCPQLVVWSSWIVSANLCFNINS